MKKQLVSIAVASALLAGSTANAFANTEDTGNGNKHQYIGAGIGAVTGALFAGPVGFIAGGLIGSLAAKQDSADSYDAEQLMVSNDAQTRASLPTADAPEVENEVAPSIALTHSGEMDSVINNDVIEDTSALKTILVTDMNLDIFFLSGSTSVEAFYKPRLQTISSLMEQMPDIDVHLEGYSDRRGDNVTNLELATQRLESVRNELVQAGIDENRIHHSAYGEQQFNSRPGDLETYTFDRRVVIRFEPATPHSKSPVASIDSPATY
jgi:outer membrane protein OmpA-like peptidoglycan-associated protein